MIYKVQKLEDVTFAVQYDGSAESLARIIYMVSDNCGYGISVTAKGNKSCPECDQKGSSITIRIAGDGRYGIYVAQLLALHIGEYLLANQKGEFTIIGSDEFDSAYSIIHSYSMED
mgnify:CR=1 FL=1